MTLKSNTLQRASFKIIQMRTGPVHEGERTFLINTLHHFREREFTPLAAAAAASFAVVEGKERQSELDVLHSGRIKH